MRKLFVLGALVGVVVVYGCGSGTSNPDGGGGGTYNIGGYYLFALPPSATGFIIATPGEPNLTDPTQPWHFVDKVASGTAYNVTVFQQPNNGTTCKVLDGGVGTVASADVTNVILTCVTALP